MKILNTQKQSGLSLIELLISMLLGAMVLAGVFQVFASTKSSNKLLQAEAQIQENARYAFTIITSIVQEAGNFGCQPSNSLSTTSIVNIANNTFRPGRVIEGWEAAGSSYGANYYPDVGSGVASTGSLHWVTSDNAAKDPGTYAKRFSDVFKVWYTKKARGSVTAVAGNVLTFNPIDIETGDIVTINDCQSLVFAQACECEDSSCDDLDTSINIDPTACATPGNNAFTTSNINIPTAEISVLEAALFFVGKRANDSHNVPTLFIRHLGDDATLSDKEEILEGVESMQVLYGEDTNNDKSPNYYVTADDVVNWNNVISLKISLLLRSSKNKIIKEAQSLDFNGTQMTITDPNDRYLRRVFTSTISLRNRNIGY